MIMTKPEVLRKIREKWPQAVDIKKFRMGDYWNMYVECSSQIRPDISVGITDCITDEQQAYLRLLEKAGIND
jgi:hypothetical protein